MISAIALQRHLDAGVMRFYFGGKKSFSVRIECMSTNSNPQVIYKCMWADFSVFLLGGGDSETGHVA